MPILYIFITQLIDGNVYRAGLDAIVASFMLPPGGGRSSFGGSPKPQQNVWNSFIFVQLQVFLFILLLKVKCIEILKCIRFALLVQ